MLITQPPKRYYRQDAINKALYFAIDNLKIENEELYENLFHDLTNEFWDCLEGEKDE